MQQIFSKIAPTQLLHVLVKTDEVAESRANLSEDSQGLQVSVVQLSKGRQVAPHIHNPRTRREPLPLDITQECWMVVRGLLRVKLFDLDRTLLQDTTLGANWLLVTFQGGHALECLEEPATMVECKNGPYLGRDYTSF